MSDTKISTSADNLGSRARPGTPEPSHQLDSDEAGLDILHLAELVPVVREKFGIEQNFSDDAILASLQTITAAGSDRARSEAAFTSNLGRYLDCSGQSREAGLTALITMLPGPRS